MSSMVIHSPQQRTLQILEIIELVLAFVDRPTANLCARVCRLWKEPALNAYWKCLDDECDFAEMLLPFLMPDAGRCRRCPPYKPLIVSTSVVTPCFWLSTSLNVAFSRAPYSFRLGAFLKAGKPSQACGIVTSHVANGRFD